jgi:hypothetical protein
MSGVHTHIAIGIPHCSRRPLVLDWRFKLLTQNWPIGINLAWIAVNDENLPAEMLPGDRISALRIGLVKAAQDVGARYLWMIDDDTEPPIHAARYLIRELESNPRAAVCAGIYGTKEPDPQPLVWRRAGSLPAVWRPGEIFPCEVIGAGCMMIRMSVFDHLSHPYFQFRDEDCTSNAYDSNVTFSYRQGEDAYFCEKVRQAGYLVLAHGGVLATHWDTDKRIPYRLPEIVKVPLPARLAAVR